MGRKKIKHYSFIENASIEIKLKEALRLFDLNGAAQALTTINDIAQKEGASNYEFLEKLLDEEIQRKEDMRIERWTKQAKFPEIKTIEGYDFTFPHFIEKDKIIKLTECSWIKYGGKVIFFGPAGVGKTHLSIALGLKAIEKSYETKFMTVDRLTGAIGVAISKDKEQGGSKNRERLLNSMVGVPLLILDELAYSSIPPEVSEFLFHLIHRRHIAQKSLILTANESFDKWEIIFGNKAKTVAAVDRLLEDCFPITIKGESYRQLHFRGNTEILKNE